MTPTRAQELVAAHGCWQDTRYPSCLVVVNEAINMMYTVVLTELEEVSEDGFVSTITTGRPPAGQPPLPGVYQDYLPCGGRSLLFGLEEAEVRQSGQSRVIPIAPRSPGRPAPLMSIRLEWQPADLWIGVFWQRSGEVLHLWIGILPCLPIHLQLARPVRQRVNRGLI
jgi:hypothetical protein